MPRFSQASFTQLSTCHHDLQALFFEVIKTYDCTIICGYRDKEAQEKAFEAGTTTLHYPASKHNFKPSMAVDVTPYPINLHDEHLHLWFGGYVLGIAKKLKDAGKMTLGVRWGGAWDGLGKLNRRGMLNDLVHFELIE